MGTEDLADVIKLGSAVPQFDTGTSSQKFFSLSTLMGMIKSKNCIMLVVKKENHVIGFMITSIQPDTKDAYMHSIFVREDYRNQGIGSQMMEQTLSVLESQKDDCNHVFGLVRIENKNMLSIMSKYGFAHGNGFYYIDMMLPRKSSN